MKIFQEEVYKTRKLKVFDNSEDGDSKNPVLYCPCGTRGYTSCQFTARGLQGNYGMYVAVTQQKLWC